MLILTVPLITDYAQSVTSLTYTWPLFRNSVTDTITIEYPDNWVYSRAPDHTIQTQFITDFYPLEIVNKDQLVDGSNTYRIYDVFFEIGKEQSLPFENVPLDLYLNYTKKWRSETGDNITNIEKTKIADELDSYKINISYSDGTKGLVFLFNRPPDSYYVFYSGTPDKYDKYLPIAQGMVNSFSFKPG